MPSFINFGFLKNNSVTSGGSVNVGQNIVQSRNATKSNNGSTNVGDGINTLPILFHLTPDSDLVDQTNIDTQNFGAPQV